MLKLVYLEHEYRRHHSGPYSAVRLHKRFYARLPGRGRLADRDHCGIFGAIHFSYFAGEFLRRHLDWDPEYVYLLAFAITFLVIVIAISLVGKVLTKIAGLAALGMLNRIFGAFFGFLKVAFVLSVILMFFNASRQDFELIPDKTLENSVLLPPVEAVAPVLLPTILDQARQHGILKKSEDLGIKKES